jgi:nitroimidazol reductase NimA-like FMN-containing flavoprotein (pyridoxamine 5'-phosphate oxidase superfamily)
MTPTSGILQGHEMTDDEIDALLRSSGVGVLSMVDEGTPYGVPLSFGYGSEDRLYFLFAGHSEEGRKVTAAERTETASFVAYDVSPDGAWQSVIVEGPIDRITADDWETAREAMGDNAYRATLLSNVDRADDPRVWALEIEHRSGRMNDPG